MSFLRKGILVSAGQIASAALGMIVGILYSRALGPNGMGRFELFRSVEVIAVTLMAAGLGNANIYFLNNRKTPLETVLANGIRFALATGILLAVLLTSMFWLMPWYFGKISLPMAVLFAAGMAMTLGRVLLGPILMAQLAVTRTVSVDLANGVVLLALGSLAVVGRALSVEAALIILACANFAGLFLVLFFLRKDIRWWHPFDWPLLKDMLVYGVKLASANLLQVLVFQVTVLMLRGWTRPASWTWACTRERWRSAGWC